MLYYTIQSFMGKRPFQNIVRKGENASLPTSFSHGFFPRGVISISVKIWKQNYADDNLDYG